MIFLAALVFFPALGLLWALADAWQSDKAARQRHKAWKAQQRQRRGQK